MLNTLGKATVGYSARFGVVNINLTFSFNSCRVCSWCQQILPSSVLQWLLEPQQWLSTSQWYSQVSLIEIIS